MSVSRRSVVKALPVAALLGGASLGGLAAPAGAATKPLPKGTFDGVKGAWHRLPEKYYALDLAEATFTRTAAGVYGFRIALPTSSARIVKRSDPFPTTYVTWTGTDDHGLPLVHEIEYSTATTSLKGRTLTVTGEADCYYIIRNAAGCKVYEQYTYTDVEAGEASPTIGAWDIQYSVPQRLAPGAYICRYYDEEMGPETVIGIDATGTKHRISADLRQAYWGSHSIALNRPGWFDDGHGRDFITCNPVGYASLGSPTKYAVRS